MNLMKVGNHLVNLDCVTKIHRTAGYDDRSDKLEIHFGAAQAALTISGEEAREAWQVLCRLAENGITK